MGYEAKQAVHFPVADYLNLEFHLMDTHPGVTPECFVTDLVKRWLTTELERSAPQRNSAPMRGFQWKNLFLPEGTSLRTSYEGRIAFARVSGDYIVSDDGASLTPSSFANLHAQGRNAWRFVWLRFPGNEQWRRAHDSRTRLGDPVPKRPSRKVAASKGI